MKYKIYFHAWERHTNMRRDTVSYIHVHTFSSPLLENFWIVTWNICWQSRRPGPVMATSENVMPDGYFSLHSSFIESPALSSNSFDVLALLSSRLGTDPVTITSVYMQRTSKCNMNIIINHGFINNKDIFNFISTIIVKDVEYKE